MAMLLIMASLATLASAKTFLHAEVTKTSVERALLSELSGLADDAQLQLIDAELGPMYTALPKNAHGGLDPAPTRYALHRYFMRKHGWYVKGLGVLNSTDGASASSRTIMKDRAPAFIQSLFEQRSQGRGLSRHDLAVFAATLTDLIHREVGSKLGDLYSKLEFPVSGPVTEQEFDAATKAYLLSYLSSGDEEVQNIEDLPRVEASLREDLQDWDNSLRWAADLKLTTDFSRRHLQNPFVEQLRSFDTHEFFLQEFGHRLGTYQNLECHGLKDRLVEMEDAGTGRVPLSRFYRGRLDGDWTFSETVELLRHMGALDETNPNRMSVVIPNYIQSQSNCIAESSFYSVCCFDECEGLLGHVEKSVQGPDALPSHVVGVVSGLHSDTVHAPRNLSEALLGRLGQIADLHGGKVPLHGRLFAQWMHHAYPRECPFPHAMGATSRLSIREYMDTMDVQSIEATDEDLALLVPKDGLDAMTPEASIEALPWTMAEELVAGHVGRASTAAPRSMHLVRLALAALVLGSVALPVARPWTSLTPKIANSASCLLV